MSEGLFISLLDLHGSLSVGYHFDFRNGDMVSFNS